MAPEEEKYLNIANVFEHFIALLCNICLRSTETRCFQTPQGHFYALMSLEATRDAIKIVCPPFAPTPPRPTPWPPPPSPPFLKNTQSCTHPMVPFPDMGGLGGFWVGGVVRGRPPIFIFCVLTCIRCNGKKNNFCWTLQVNNENKTALQKIAATLKCLFF